MTAAAGKASGMPASRPRSPPAAALPATVAMDAMDAMDAASLAAGPIGRGPVLSP